MVVGDDLSAGIKTGELDSSRPDARKRIDDQLASDTLISDILADLLRRQLGPRILIDLYTLIEAFEEKVALIPELIELEVAVLGLLRPVLLPLLPLRHLPFQQRQVHVDARRRHLHQQLPLPHPHRQQRVFRQVADRAVRLLHRAEAAVESHVDVDGFPELLVDVAELLAEQCLPPAHFELAQFLAGLAVGSQAASAAKVLHELDLLPDLDGGQVGLVGLAGPRNGDDIVFVDVVGRWQGRTQQAGAEQPTHTLPEGQTHLVGVTGLSQSVSVVLHYSSAVIMCPFEHKSIDCRPPTVYPYSPSTATLLPFWALEGKLELYCRLLDYLTVRTKCVAIQYYFRAFEVKKGEYQKGRGSLFVEMQNDVPVLLFPVEIPRHQKFVAVHPVVPEVYHVHIVLYFLLLLPLPRLLLLLLRYLRGVTGGSLRLLDRLRLHRRIHHLVFDGEVLGGFFDFYVVEDFGEFAASDGRGGVLLFHLHLEQLALGIAERQLTRNRKEILQLQMDVLLLDGFGLHYGVGSVRSGVVAASWCLLLDILAVFGLLAAFGEVSAQCGGDQELFGAAVADIYGDDSFGLVVIAQIAGVLAVGLETQQLGELVVVRLLLFAEERLGLEGGRV